MHPLVLLMLIAVSSSLAHYGGSYESRNLIVREEPHDEIGFPIVECPVCEDTGSWLPSNEICTIVKGNKKYKKCELGTYVNEVCGNRLDCYRGRGEKCTVKREFDTFGQQCAPGYYCNKPLGVCTGRDYTIDSNVLWLINSHPYQHDSLRRGEFKTDNSKFGLDGIRN